MTLPDERYNAVNWTREFLRDLCVPEETPRVPKQIRERARALLRHYPNTWHLDRVCEIAPDVFNTGDKP